MKALAVAHLSTQAEAITQPARHGALGKMQVMGAVVGLAGSVCVALIGALLIAAGWFVANDAVRHWLSTTGSVLLCLTIPLIILAAYCLDWVEKDKPQRWSKVARYDDKEDEF